MPKVVAKSKSAAKPTKVVKTVAGKIVKKKAVKSLGRNYFTVGEDLVISETLTAQSNLPKSTTANTLANKLGRTVESIRDRIKRYHDKISAADKATLAREGKKNPTHYAFFAKTGTKGDKKIEKITSEEPILQNRTLSRKPRQAIPKPPKVPAKLDKQTFEERTSWIVKKLNDADPYFKLDFSIQLLADVFANLVKVHKIPKADVEKYIESVHKDVSLEEILNHFVLKNNKK